MPRQLSAAAGLLLALSLGCAAGRHPAPMPEPPGAADLRHQMATWIVGVREPEVRYSAPDAPGPTVVDEVRDAGRLIAALRGTGLFAEVDFTHQLRCPPDLELSVLAHKGESLDSAPAWMLPLTLSLAILDDEEGAAFTPAGDPDAVFAFHYPTTLDVGLLPLLASPVLITGVVPTWSLMSSGDPDGQLARFLLRNADRLKRYVHRPAAGTCRAGRSAATTPASAGVW